MGSHYYNVKKRFFQGLSGELCESKKGKSETRRGGWSAVSTFRQSLAGWTRIDGKETHHDTTRARRKKGLHGPGNLILVLIRILPARRRVIRFA